jgi:hypothetical protein
MGEFLQSSQEFQSGWDISAIVEFREMNSSAVDIGGLTEIGITIRRGSCPEQVHFWP